MGQYLIYFDYLGVALFAATGALTASRRQLDIMGFVFLAILTGIGGGSVRDVVLDQPVFWVSEQVYLVVCAAAALLVYLTAHRLESRYRTLQWIDAVAVAVYAIYGAHKGLGVTGSPLVAVLTGAMTGTLGGILRDVLAGEPNVVTRQEIYVSAAVIGAAAFVGLRLAGLPMLPAGLAGALLTFALRAGALAFGWTLPRYRSRPGRPVGKN